MLNRWLPCFANMAFAQDDGVVLSSERLGRAAVMILLTFVSRSQLMALQLLGNLLSALRKSKSQSF